MSTYPTNRRDRICSVLAEHGEMTVSQAMEIMREQGDPPSWRVCTDDISDMAHTPYKGGGPRIKIVGKAWVPNANGDLRACKVYRYVGAAEFAAPPVRRAIPRVSSVWQYAAAVGGA